MKRLFSIVLLLWPLTPSFGGQHSGIGPATPVVPDKVPPFPRPRDEFRIMRPVEAQPVDKSTKPAPTQGTDTLRPR